MSVKLIRKTESFAYKVEGSTFYYRRITDGDAAVIRQKHTDSQGELDNQPFLVEILEHCLIGWEGVTEPDGADVKFDKKDIQSLPAPLILDLVSRIRGEMTDDKYQEMTKEKKS